MYMQNETTLETKIRDRLSEMENSLKKVKEFDSDYADNLSIVISELEYCIIEFKMLLGIDAEREQMYVQQQVE